MQYFQEHLKTMVYAKFGGQTECIMGNWKIENCLGEVPEAIAYKCFKFNWFDFHWVTKDEMQYHWEDVAYEAT